MAKEVPTIKFVRKDEAQQALESYGITLERDSKCSVCGDQITMQNIGAVVPRSHGAVFVCSKANCMAVSNITASEEAGEGGA